MCVCVCVCVCGVCVCVCVWERERERERVTAQCSGHVCVCVCACMSERGRHGHTTALVCKHIGHHRVCHATLFHSRAWTDDKTKDSINCLYFHFESWSSRLWKEALHFRCGLWCSANRNALCQWPIRADCACRKEDFNENEATNNSEHYLKNNVFF